MNDKKYLTEENYRNNTKKVLRLSLIILIIGVLLGGSLIVTGAVLSHNAKGVNIDLVPEKESENLRTESEVQADINTIKPKISSLNAEIVSLEMDLWKIQNEEGLSENYYSKQAIKEAKETELLNLQTELEKYEKELNNIKIDDSKISSQLEQFEGIFNFATDKISKARYMPYYFIGGFVIVASIMIAGVIYIFAKRREITAYTTQQVMPVVKEGIDDITPTVANAVGEVAKEIKEGINEAEK